MKQNTKKKVLSAVCLIYAAALCQSAAGPAFAEMYGDSSYSEVTVYPEQIVGKISPFIYGINDCGDLYGVTATVLKQTGDELSTYNWETNYSNSSVDGVSSNGISLIENFNDTQWDVPGLYTDNLVTHAFVNGIPVRLVTLQLMGYVANDAMGAVSEGANSPRWAKTAFRKNDSYLNVPNKGDGIVYIDEYAAYLVNKYGTVEEGGINGFFLDSEPDRWNEKYPVLELGEIDAEELISNSAELSASVKIIDENALIFAPSVSGVSACADLSGNFIGDRSFAEYYLSEMRKAGEKEGKRLLDAFDLHYYAEKGSSVNGSALSEKAFRMQSVRALWDSEYSDDTSLYASYEENMPLLPWLNEVIDRCYPNTKLSISEYSFGGGGDMSGCIAQIDALGTFAENNVYLACLVPDEAGSYQKSAINLFTDYDYKGSRVGNISVRSDLDDITASCYAISDELERDRLWVILANKNLSGDKTFDIRIRSDRSFSLTEMYSIGGNSSHITKENELPDLSDGQLTLPAESVCLLVFDTDDDFPEESAEVTEDTSAPSDGEESAETSEEDPAEHTIEIITENTATSSESETMTEETEPPHEETSASAIPDSAEPASSAEETDASESDVIPNEPAAETKEFPLGLKAAAVVLVVGCAGAIVYVLLIDR
ncbi:MAG: glycoside hydrolase family 44 protein [Oscillospiraceae bacterium]